MYRKLSTEEKRLKRGGFESNPIYQILYLPLWRIRGEDLSPEEIWIEGNNLASELKQYNHADIEIKVREIFDDLCNRYTIFKDEANNLIRRNFQQAEHSAMKVSLVAFLLLLNINSDAANHPYGDICKAIGDVIGNIDGFRELYEETRLEEDNREAQGNFIEVADYIEQISMLEEPLSEKQLTKARLMFGQFVEENKYCDLPTKYANERMIARVNDNNNHCLQSELDLLRKHIKEVEGNDGQNVEYRNIIFAKKYEDKVSAIRHAIYPFVSNGTDHINPKEQRQWLAIVEPLMLIEGLLIEHLDKPKHKKCTNGEICQQLCEFYGREYPDVDFNKIPKSIDSERRQWRVNGVGLTFESWHKYAGAPHGKPKYKSLARVAERVYGEIKRVIEG